MCMNSRIDTMSCLCKIEGFLTTLTLQDTVMQFLVSRWSNNPLSPYFRVVFFSSLICSFGTLINLKEFLFSAMFDFLEKYTADEGSRCWWSYYMVLHQERRKTLVKFFLTWLTFGSCRAWYTTPFALVLDLSVGPNRNGKPLDLQESPRRKTFRLSAVFRIHRFYFPIHLLMKVVVWTNLMCKQSI